MSRTPSRSSAPDDSLAQRLIDSHGTDAAIVVDGYRVLRKLGEGGMADVFEAREERTGRRAAIKILKPQHRGVREIWARFFNEARAAHYIRHPGVIDIYCDGVLQPEQLPYIIMEYLEGESLWARFQRLQERYHPSFVRIIRQIASAMAAVHAQGIVHRDLKPQNVMLVPDPDMPNGERAKILDFGIAKLQQQHFLPPGTPFSDIENNADLQTMIDTRVHQSLIGTPLYMSPQQCSFSSALDSKSDVYSLGSLAYRLLSGRPLFPATDLRALISLHLLGEPEPLREIAPWLRPDLSALVHRMLAKDPVQRPSMREVAQALANWDDERAAPAPSAPPPAAPARAPRRPEVLSMTMITPPHLAPRWLPWLLLLLVLALTLTGVVWLAQR